LRRALEGADVKVYERTTNDPLMGNRPQVIVVLHNDDTNEAHAIATILESKYDYGFAYRRVVEFVAKEDLAQPRTCVIV
jgi:hypothetical protein